MHNIASVGSNQFSSMGKRYSLCRWSTAFMVRCVNMERFIHGYKADGLGQ